MNPVCCTPSGCVVIGDGDGRAFLSTLHLFGEGVPRFVHLRQPCGLAVVEGLQSLASDQIPSL